MITSAGAFLNVRNYSSFAVEFFYPREVFDMENNAEEGIARVQLAATRAKGTQGDRLRQHHGRSIVYLDERIWSFVFGIALLGLIAVWATATSQLVIYGSFTGVILLTIIWGSMRVKRIEKNRLEREREAQSWPPENSTRAPGSESCVTGGIPSIPGSPSSWKHIRLHVHGQRRRVDEEHKIPPGHKRRRQA